MLDQWFEEELQDHFKNYDKLLLLDTDEEYEFLIKEVKQRGEINVKTVRNKVDDIRTKYEIEQADGDQSFLIYSTLPKEELNYCREYGETNPTSEELRKSLPRFIQSKLDYTISNMKPSDFLMLGQASLGEGEDFWDTVQADGKDAVLGNFERNLVEFLSDPEEKYSKFEDSVWEVFCQKIETITGLTASEKPPATLAEEFVDFLFGQILRGEMANQDLQAIYKEWIRDSATNNRLVELASQYDLPSDTDLWEVDPNHPFRAIDKKMAAEVIKHLGDEKWIRKRKPAIRARAESEAILDLIGVDFWNPLLNLLTPSIYIEAHEIEGLDQFIEEAYPDNLAKIDGAIRHLYSSFGNEQELKQRLEEYYTTQMEPYWNEWFKRFVDEYQPEQIGLLDRIFSNANEPCAVIVGDGVSYELAEEITASLSKTAYSVDLDVERGCFPSTTLKNKSMLFDVKGEISGSRNEMEETLSESIGAHIEALNLSEYSGGSRLNYDRLVLYQNDTDDLLEKLSSRGLKYLSKARSSLVESIQELLNNGFGSVHLVSDHGFVLYGSVEDADKIPVENRPDDIEIKDRYIATKEPLDPPPNNSIHIEKDYKEYNHLYFAKGLKPYLSPNEYGFAHGGVTPQELLVPHLTVKTSKEAVGQQLEVSIANKDALKELAVANVDIILEAEAVDELLESNRSVYLEFYREGIKFKDTNVITVTAGHKEKFETRFDNMEDCQVQLRDAETKKTLDKANLHFESARDLGGLMDE